MPIFDHHYFDALYRKDIDPWKFRSSEYERQKYQKTVLALSGSHFKKCLELGCSIGALTQHLLSCCERIVAIDISSLALEEARMTCQNDRVEFRQAHLPEGYLGNGYDLVVASEVLYYLEAPALCHLARRLHHAVTPSALFVSVHWTGETNYPLHADEATQLCFEEGSIELLHSDIEPQFRLDVGRFLT